MTTRRLGRRRPLAGAVLLALLAPGLAFAQTDKERELEARVAQLEQLVQQLLAQQQQTQGQVEQVRAAQATAAAGDGKPRIQTAPIMPGANPGTVFSYGGFIKFDAMWTDTPDGEIADGSVGRLFYLPSTIPVGGAGEDADLDTSAQWSRFWFGADTTLESGDKLKAYIEVDLFGGGSILGNETATNTYGVAVRHAYVSWNRWLAGQTWSNFQDVAVLPDTVDFVGPTEGTVFVRQAQIRYTHGPWSFSAENPETWITAFQGGAVKFGSDDNNLPDFTARYTAKGDWGHFSVAGLLRQLRHETTTGIDSSETGFGASVSGKFNLGKNDDIRYMLTGGSGIGRYVGFGLGPDAVLDAGGGLEASDMLAGFIAWRHAFGPKVRTNLFYSRAEIDNDVALTGLGATRSAQSWHANVIWSPLPKLDVGAELILGERELESGDEGELRRLHTHVKYSF